MHATHCNEADLKPTDRRHTRRYRAKKRIVRDLWIGVGLTMLAVPHIGAVIILGLMGTFLGFAILDETR